MQQWPPDNTFRNVRDWLLNRLSGAHSESREIESWVRILLEWQSGLNRAQLLAVGYLFTESQLNLLAAAVRRLNEGEPLQHITGTAWFYGRPFKVSPDVLIPRPETEELVSLILAQLPDDDSLRVLDIGTGSGCIPITLKLERPDLHAEAWDVSEAALSVAVYNAKALDASVTFRQADVLLAEAAESFDVVVSNPPYITLSEVMELDPRVRNHEPQLALAVPDNDPLVFYKRIIALSTVPNHPLLSAGGQLWFECHERYAEQVAALCECYGSTVLRLDAQGRERIVQLMKSEGE